MEWKSIEKYWIQLYASTKWKYSVKHKSNGTPERIVDLKMNAYPICTCPSFRSNLILCQHISSVFASAELVESQFQEEFLSPWWHITKHPFYSEAMKMLGFETSHKNYPQGNRNDGSVTIMDAYRHIVYPGTDVARYTKLKVEFDKGVEHATQNQHTFKMALLGIQQWATSCAHHFVEEKNQIMSSCPPSRHKPQCISSWQL